MFDPDVIFTSDHYDALIQYLKHHRDAMNTIEDVLSELEYRRLSVGSDAA